MKNLFVSLFILATMTAFSPTASAQMAHGGRTDSLGTIRTFEDTLTIAGVLYYVSKPLPITNLVMRFFQGPDSTITLFQRYSIPSIGASGQIEYEAVYKPLTYYNMMTQTYGAGTYAFDGVQGKLQANDPGMSGAVVIAITPKPASPIYYDVAW